MKQFIKKHPAAILLVILIGVIAGLNVFTPYLGLALPLVGMALAKDRTQFSVKGGGSFKIRELTSGGADTTMLFVGYLKETQFDINADIVQFKDDTGRIINQLRSGEEWLFTIITPQVGIDIITLLRTANAKFFHVYYCSAQMQNGNWQEIYLPLAVVEPVFSRKFAPGENTVQLKVRALMPKGAVAVTPAGFNVAADTYGTIVETATTPLGEVTTATGTIYTAAV